MIGVEIHREAGHNRIARHRRLDATRKRRWRCPLTGRTDTDGRNMILYDQGCRRRKIRRRPNVRYDRQGFGQGGAIMGTDLGIIIFAMIRRLRPFQCRPRRAILTARFERFLVLIAALRRDRPAACVARRLTTACRCWNCSTYPENVKLRDTGIQFTANGGFCCDRLLFRRGIDLRTNKQSVSYVQSSRSFRF